MKYGKVLAFSGLLLFGCGALDELASPVPMSAQEANSIRGTVVEVQPHLGMLTLRIKNSNRLIQFTDDARIMRSTGPNTPAFKPARLMDVKPGMTVRVDLTGQEFPTIPTAYEADALYIESGTSQPDQTTFSGTVEAADETTKTLRVRMKDGVRFVLVTKETAIQVLLGPDMPPILHKGELWTRMVGRPVDVAIADILRSAPPQYVAASLTVR